MASKHQNLVVGMFTILGLAVLGGLIIVFGGGRTLLVKSYTIDAAFTGGVAGVQGGQTVTLNGKRIGETKDLFFLDDAHPEQGVFVKVNVEGFDLPAASELIISPPAMGLGKPLIQLVVLDPKDNRKLSTDGTARVPGRMLPALDQLVPIDMQTQLLTAMSQIGDLAAALKPAAANFNRLLDVRRIPDVDQQTAVANVDSVVQRFDTSLKNLNTVIGSDQNQKNFSDLLANAKKISESGVTAMQNFTEISGRGKQLVDNTTQLMQRLTTLAEDMSVMIKRMDSVVVAMNAKSGTIGLMLNDNRLYEEMLLTMKRMTKMLDDFREVADLAKKGQLRIKYSAF